MLQLGLTGGIGSGKSTVAKLFEALGIPVYDADQGAKRLMEENPEVRLAIQQLLGQNAYLEDGHLNRPWIAEQVFQEPKKLKELEAIVHPAVHRDANAWHHQQDAPYTLREAALLYESGGAKLVDAVIVVTAPEEVRVQRVMERDGVTREQVLARMRNQWPQQEKDELADFLIINDGSHLLIPQVWNIHQQILQPIQ
jgi:dephospho-CoA kinase